MAILLVVGRHLELPRPAGVAGAFAEIWYRLGWLGVDLFFTLSGFLIGGLLLMELERHGTINVPRFLIRRGLKIYPLYYVFMAYLILMPAAKQVMKGGDAWAILVSQFNSLWPNLLFLQNYVGSNPVGHTWSLAVEEHFYLVLPFVLVALVAAKRVRVVIPLFVAFVPLCLALRCLSVWTQDPFSTRMAATHLRIDALLVGVSIRGMAQYMPELFMSFRRWRWVLLLAGTVFWLPNNFIEPNTSFVRTVGLTGTLLGSASFLLATYHIHGSDFVSVQPPCISACRICGTSVN